MGWDAPVSVAVDSGGSVYVAGTTSSPNFPITADSAPLPALGGGGQVSGSFLAKLDGSQLSYSGYFDHRLFTGMTLGSHGDILISGNRDGIFAPADRVAGDLFLDILRFAPASTRPTIATGGIVDVFNLQRGRAAPGSVVSIYGSNFTSISAQASGPPLPLSLAGTSVTVDGRQAPLYYAGPGQINMQVPLETKPGVSQVVVSGAQGASAAAAMLVRPAAPSILVDPNTNRVIAFNQDNTFNGPGNPAPVGTIVTVYFTGLGPATGGPATGFAATAATPASLPSSATIGKTAAKIEYIGLTPGIVGLAQANIAIPAVPASEYPLVLTIGGVASNWSTISIAGAAQ
jgi:uncharacterized protein (TIGR03437 family)